MSLDINAMPSSKTAEEGFDLELKDAQGKPSGAFIRVRGADSASFRACQREIQRRRVDHARANLKLLPERLEEDELDLLTGATVGWRGLEENGAPIDFSEARARELYRQVPAIKEQVDAAIHNRANFLPRSGTA